MFRPSLQSFISLENFRIEPFDLGQQERQRDLWDGKKWRGRGEKVMGSREGWDV